MINNNILYRFPRVSQVSSQMLADQMLGQQTVTTISRLLDQMVETAIKARVTYLTFMMMAGESQS